MKYEMVTLDELVSIKGGGTPSKDKAEYWNGNIPWASVKDLTSLWLSSTIDHISEEGLRNSSANLIKAGTIIIPTRMALGKVSINTIDVAINQDLKALSIKNNKTTSINYLKYFLISKADEIEKNGKGATVKGITIDVIKNLRIPLPPLPEQTRIAAILDQADKIRQKRRRAAALADEFLRSVFLEMFGDPVSNPKGWEVRKFEEVGSLDRGKSKHRPRNDPKLLGGNHPLIQTGDVANCNGYIKTYTATYSDLGLAQSKKWQSGTLCITIAANIAKTGILTFDACFPDSVVGFLPNAQVTTEYVRFWLSFLQKILEDKAPESAQKNINLAILKSLEIPVPDIEKQRLFSKICADYYVISDKLELQASQADMLFQSLSQQFFNPT